MTIETSNAVLSLLRTSLNRREMQVLQAVTELTGTESGATLTSIAQVVNSARGPPISSNWIYKCLQSLQEKELLSVDLLRRPSVYRADSSTLEKGVLGLIDARLAQLGREREKLEGELSSLRLTEPREMAEHLVATLSGQSLEHSREVLMGSQRVWYAIARQINLSAIEGSVVRIMQGLEGTVGVQLSISRFEQAVFEAIGRGATVHAILFSSEIQASPEQGLVRFMGAIGPSLVDALESGGLQLRLLTGPSNTYRMLCIDEHTMIMFLSTAYVPDAAVLIQSVDDLGLVGDAIRTFDERWEVSSDLNGPILSLLTPDKSLTDRT